MPNLRADFTQGKMNLDADERLLPEGEFRRAENIYIANSEGSTVGSISKSYSNKQLTSLNLGANPKCLLGYADEFRKKIYYFILSDSGCYLLEWDENNEVISIVLEDTRAIGSRVLDLKATHLITGIGKIITENVNNDLFTWTDDNMEPCCINIERAKTYGANNFTKEDIYLIKKPPIAAPTLLPLNISGLTNNMEERFLSFCYRYKYLDGEYSATSTYTNYSFTPKKFDIDYYTLDNKGMVNAFNAVRTSFNTGEKQVTDIQLLVKESNSNNLYVIETFNKQNEGWNDGQIQNFIFSNNKIYQILPAKELFRACDMVPLKAKSLTIIGNTIVFGDYVEGRNIVDANGVKIYPDYSLSLINEPIDNIDLFPKTFPNPNELSISNPAAIPLNQGNKLVFYINLMIAGSTSYDRDFYYILPQNYATLLDVFASTEFTDFISIINSDIRANFEFTVPDNWVVTIEPSFIYSVVSGNPLFTITPITFTDTTDSSTHVVNFEYFSSSYVSVTSSSNSTSLKTERDYEVGIEYDDDFCRNTTVITALYNSIFVPQLYSTFKNRIKINLNSPAPFWAKRYRFVVKSQPLEYQTIYVNKFYNDIDNFYVWCKLEAENKDKVKVGDILIVKKGPNPISTAIKIKVLEIKDQPKDFITGNNDNNGNPIIEDAGLYMKIRPEGFSMDFDDYRIYQNEFGDVGARSGFPVGYLDLFTQITGSTITELSIPAGSSIYIFMNSSFAYRSGWLNATYETTHYSQRNYVSIEDWFIDNIVGKNLFITDSSNVSRNYGPQVSLVRGFKTIDSFGNTIFTADSLGKLYFRIVGLESGGSGGRSGYVRAKIVVRTNTGFYVFETEPKQAEQNLYYQTSQTFDIVDGNHMGNLQNQDVSSLTPAIIDLDFFNCYTQGNGVESYKIRDGFNTKALNIDLRPCTTLIEEYKEVRRFAYLCHGQPYVESTNMNGLNEFNVSTINFKELDKQYGSVQKLLSRDNDIVVFQEEKISKILFNKTALFKATGTVDITTSDKVLGEQITYLGENGIGKNPESVAVNDYQIYSANPRRGIMQRLSIDGVEDIIYGMIDYFRDTFIAKPFSKKIGGFDPYHKQFVISIGNEPTRIYNVNCGNTINKSNQSTPFTYTFNLNDLVGDIILNYDITLNNATITANYDGVDYVASNVNGPGTITIARTDLSITTVQVTIVPVSSSISYQIGNSCPVGISAKVVSIVLNDLSDSGKTITNKYRWGGSQFFSSNDLFTDDPINKFITDTGIEGQGKIPLRGQIVNIQSLKDLSDTGEFNLDNCNRIGYLISTNIYTDADINTILSDATFLTLSDSGNIKNGNFLFNKTDNDEILYLIWDYTDRKPVLVDDSISVLPTDPSVVIHVLDNDTLNGEDTISIVTPPTNGTVVINLDNTITYTPSGVEMVEDSFVYSVGTGSCIATATVTISVFSGFDFINVIEEDSFTEFDIITNDGSIRLFNYEIGVSRSSNTKPTTKLYLNSLSETKILLAPAHSTVYTATGSIEINGIRHVRLDLICSPASSHSNASANGYFKRLEDTEQVVVNYSFTGI